MAPVQSTGEPTTPGPTLAEREPTKRGAKVAGGHALAVVALAGGVSGMLDLAGPPHVSPG